MSSPNDLTEEEAGKLWCPMARTFYASSTSGGYSPAHNRFDDNLKTMCVGSRCMMWCWEDAANVANLQAGYVRRGRCGLAR